MGPPDGPGRDGRSCVCNSGFTGNGELCVAFSSASTGSSSSSDDGVSTSTLVFILLLAVLVIAVVVVGVKLSKKSDASAADRRPPGAPSIAFENPIYNSAEPTQSGRAAAAQQPRAEGGYIDVDANTGVYD